MLSGNQNWIAYTGDGASLNFTIPFYYIDQLDILVTVAPLGARNQPVTKIVNVDYYITDIPVDGVRVNGGTVIFVVAPAAGSTVLLVNRTPRNQTHVYTPNDPFPAKSHEAALDKVTLLVEQVMSHCQGVADGPPTRGVYQVGDWFWIRIPVLGGSERIICVTAGDPGVWAQTGQISLISGML